MKNNILFIGIVLIVLNTIIGLIVSAYKPFNMMFVDISLIISLALTFLLSNSSIADAFKIGLTLLFVITGLVRVVCAFISPNILTNNFIVIVFLAVFAFEAVAFFIANSLKRE
ncbi:MAG: hypothetical protein NTW25_00350 [Candidatus Kapabacteria bacterium]|nr:hypothetical protein [Candidatus Kapabacteria bacterium]